MFERFTADARSTVMRAVEQAQALGSTHVDSRHILLALIDTDDSTSRQLRASVTDAARLSTRLASDITSSSIDGEALASLGIDLREVSARADMVFGAGALSRSRATRKHVPFRTDAKKVLELALREAVRLRDNSIETRHILLGVLRADCPARATLTSIDVDINVLRSSLDAHDAA